VLGASVSNIITLLTTNFLKPVAMAIVIAIPISLYAMNQWLGDFEYKVDIGWWIFVAAGMIAILIALFTVSFQAIKAAIANPVKSLRME
jgi:putative ABC transport system permease protein